MKLFICLGQLSLHLAALLLEPNQLLVQFKIILLEEHQLRSAFVILAFVLLPPFGAKIRPRYLLKNMLLLGLLVVDLQLLGQVSDNAILLHNDLLKSLYLCLLLLHLSMQDRLLPLASL